VQAASPIWRRLVDNAFRRAFPANARTAQHLSAISTSSRVLFLAYIPIHSHDQLANTSSAAFYETRLITCRRRVALQSGLGRLQRVIALFCGCRSPVCHQAPQAIVESQSIFHHRSIANPNTPRFPNSPVGRRPTKQRNSKRSHRNCNDLIAVASQGRWRSSRNII
jgi:hypothetical protein